MGALLDGSLYSPVTLLGFVWSVATYYLMLSSRGRVLFSNWRWIPVFGAALAYCVWYVVGEVNALTAMAGGLQPLDVVYGYDATAIAPLAEALDTDGRRAYAEFQLRADTLAPPAFACFLMSVFHSTVRFAAMKRLLTALVFTYFTAVLLANSLMPLIILNYPDQSGALALLYAIVPLCDLTKYTVHALAWIVVIGSWIATPIYEISLKDGLSNRN